MSRRQLLLGCTVVIASIYAVLFYAVFCVSEERSEPVLLQQPVSEKIDTLYWLQAGVFKEKSSYEQLQKQLSDSGFTVYCIPKDELTVVIMNPEVTKDEYNRIKKQADDAGIEVIEKQAVLNETQIELWENKEIEKLLKELVNE